MRLAATTKALRETPRTASPSTRSLLSLLARRHRRASSTTAKSKEVTDRQYLAFRFAETSKVDVVGDELDPDSIDIGDFYVEGFSILSYIHPTDETGTDFDGDTFDPRSRVYVKLDRALGSGERPEVQLRHGAVRDLAGNPNDGTAPEKAIDRIGPLLTVTVNGAVQDRPVIMADDGELDIDVSADETLRGRPEIWFAKIAYTEAERGWTLPRHATRV